MTEALRGLVGPNVYDTLTRSLQFLHGDWLARKKVPGHWSPWLMVTQEGVDKLGSWTETELDALSGIGPKKAGLIYKALKELYPESSLKEDPQSIITPKEPTYFPE